MSEKSIIAIASDHAGLELKAHLKELIVQQGMMAEDFGTHTTESVDYPDYANALCAWVLQKPERKGVLICGSGIGMSIAANRHKGIRAALCAEGLSSELSRRHNNANILCLGARLVGAEAAKECLNRFLTTAFDGGRHEKRVEKLG